MTVLSATGISLAFGTRKILDRVSFSLNEGDKLGIVGPNGEGKTTLLRVLLSRLLPDEGRIFLAKDKTVGYLSQDDVSIGNADTVTPLHLMEEAFAEVLAIGREIEETEHLLSEEEDEATIRRLSGRLSELHRRYTAEGGIEARGRCRSFLLKMGFSEEEHHRPLSSFSGGQKRRLILCRLLLSEPDILLLDEPTNHLDADALLWLEEFLSSYRKTVLVVSHDRYFLDRITNKTLRLDRGSAKLYLGNYSTYRLTEAEDALTLEHQYKEQRKVIARIEANIAFQRRCGQAHNFVTIRSKEKQLERMEKITLDERRERKIKLRFEGEASGEDVLRVEKLAFGYTEEPLFRDLSFEVKRGERILLLGDNGCGKSTLLRLLAGRLSHTKGALFFGHRIEVGYYDQEMRSFSEESTVFEEIKNAYPLMPDGELRATLARFLFPAEEIEKKISLLSGGERARLTLCKLMLKKVNLLLLDEPTNHLDIEAREVLEEALEEFEGTVIAVSHDRYFIDKLATRILEIRRDGLLDLPLTEEEPPYATYLGKRERAVCATLFTAHEEPKRTEPGQGKDAYLERKKQASEERQLAKRKAEAEKRIPLLEKRLEELDLELFGPAASDYVRAAEIDKEKTEIEEELLTLYELVL